MSKYLLGTCSAPPIPENAFIRYSDENENGTYNRLVVFQCNEGYNASIGVPNW